MIWFRSIISVILPILIPGQIKTEQKTEIHDKQCINLNSPPFKTPYLDIHINVWTKIKNEPYKV